MVALIEKINNDLVKAQKGGDSLTVSTLRLLNSALKNREIELRTSGQVLDEGVVLSVISKEIKQRQESVAEYEKAGRKDLVEKESAEMKILQGYLPPQLGDAEVLELVTSAIAESGASSISDMGKVMAILAPKIKGKADGGKVSTLVKERLKG